MKALLHVWSYRRSMPCRDSAPSGPAIGTTAPDITRCNLVTWEDMDL